MPFTKRLCSTPPPRKTVQRHCSVNKLYVKRTLLSPSRSQAIMTQVKAAPSSPVPSSPSPVPSSPSPSPAPSSPLFLPTQDSEEEPNGMSILSVQFHTHDRPSAPSHNLDALESLATLDTDSDSDIVPLPGLPSSLPYPNCCRWHLTEVRCRYKWDAPSICAPFAIRIASTDQYSAAEGTLTDCLGLTQIHSPIAMLAALPSPSIAPPLDTPILPASPATPEDTRATFEPRWYAITKGRGICVVQGWSVNHHRQHPITNAAYLGLTRSP